MRIANSTPWQTVITEEAGGDWPTRINIAKPGGDRELTQALQLLPDSSMIERLGPLGLRVPCQISAWGCIDEARIRALFDIILLQSNSLDSER